MIKKLKPKIVKLVVRSPGPQGPPGPSTVASSTPGPQGWSPVIAVVEDGARRVQRIVGWTGGAGTAPSTGLYIGPAGLVGDISQATDIRGETGGGGGGGGGNSFTTIAVSGQSSIVADSTTDTLTVAAGTATTLTTNAGTDTLTVGVALGTSGATACAGNDSRLSDARTPLAHAASHASGGGDALTLAQSQVTNLVSDLAGKAASSHTHTASQVTDFSEAVDDRVAALLVAGTNVTLSYNDAGNALTINATGGGGGGAPTTADYLVRTADAGLSAERVVTDSTTVTANWGTSGQVAFERAALTGDVTASANSNATTIAAGVVTTTKMGGDVTTIGKSLLTAADAAAERALLGLGGSAVLNVGTGVGTVAAGNDSRLSDARTPTSHAASHASGGGDQITIAQSQVTSLTSDLALKAPLASPAFTGAPTAPTAAADTNTTQVATCAFVLQEIGNDTTKAAASHTHTASQISDSTTAGRALLTGADASAQRISLGLGTLATQSGTFSGTSSGTNTGDQNLFSTIAVSGQSNVVADAASDTLTLVAGSNITITTNATTDEITIAASGGGGSVGTDTIWDAAGDLVYGTGSNTATRLAIGDSMAKLYNTGSAPFWGTANNTWTIEEHFFGVSGENFAYSNSGGSSNYLSAQANADHPGVLRLGATNNGNFAGIIIGGSTGWLTFGGGESIFEASVYIENVSDGTDSYSTRIGFIESAAGTQVDGVFFIHDQNSANWQIQCRAASTGSASSSNTAVAVGWVRLRIVVNAAGNSASFFVNGTQVNVSPLTANIPTGSNMTAVGGQINKTLGTNARPWKNNPDNPMGLPGDYPDEVKADYKEGEPIPNGYIVATEEEYKKAIENNLAAAKAAISAFRQAQVASDDSRLDAYKRLFSDGRAIDQNWATATAAQRLELSRIVFRILWLSRSSLAELVKPDAS